MESTPSKRELRKLAYGLMRLSMPKWFTTKAVTVNGHRMTLGAATHADTSARLDRNFRFAKALFWIGVVGLLALAGVRSISGQEPDSTTTLVFQVMNMTDEEVRFVVGSDTMTVGASEPIVQEVVSEEAAAVVTNVNGDTLAVSPRSVETRTFYPPVVREGVVEVPVSFTPATGIRFIGSGLKTLRIIEPAEDGWGSLIPEPALYSTFDDIEALVISVIDRKGDSPHVEYAVMGHVVKD